MHEHYGITGQGFLAFPGLYSEPLRVSALRSGVPRERSQPADRGLRLGDEGGEAHGAERGDGVVVELRGASSR